MTHFTRGGTRTKGPEELGPFERAWVMATGVRVPRPENEVLPFAMGLHYTTETISLNRGGALEVWTIPTDSAKGHVLLFHGYAASKSSLLAEAWNFHEMGWGPILVDFRGSGGSTGDDTTIGIREVEDVDAAVRFANAHGTGPLVLYGKSLGSVAILRAVAVLGTRADELILESPFNRLVDTVGNRFRSMGLPAFPLAHLLVFWGSLQIGSSGFKHNPEDYARNVYSPVLLFSGGKDSRVTKAQAESVFSPFPGPKEFVFFEDSGHLSFIGKHPGEWKERVRRFLEHVPSPASNR